MKILVPIKRVPDPDQKIHVRTDGSGIETDNLEFQINPFDAIALEEALCIRERLSEPVNVVAVSIGGDEYEAELRLALAIGADQALLVQYPQPLDPWNVARLLCAVVQRENPQLVIMGKQAVDDDANQTGQFLASLLDWPQATFASKLDLVDGGLRVDRETDAGVERVRVSLPAVVTTDLRLNEPRYAALPSIVRAMNKPLKRVPLEELGQVVEARIRILHMATPSTERCGIRVKDVDELLRRLRDEAELIKH